MNSDRARFSLAISTKPARLRFAVAIVRLGACVALLTAVWQWNSAASAVHARDTAWQRADQLAEQLREIDRLSRVRETALPTAPPKDAVTRPLLTALRTAGLAESTLQRQSGGAEERVGQSNHGFAQREVRAVLGPITLPQLGAFIAAWKSAQPAWVITELTLSHNGPSDKYSAAIQFTATYAIEATTPKEPS